MAGDSSRKQNTIVLAAAVSVILLSVLLTLYVSGRLFDGALFSAPERGYRNVTFTDAVLTCKSSTRQQFGASIRSLEVDDHSSRFDEREYVYKIFLQVETPAKKDAGLSLHYVNCFVRSGSGAMSKWESYEDKEQKTNPVYEKGTNLFGWPR